MPLTPIDFRMAKSPYPAPRGKTDLAARGHGYSSSGKSKGEQFADHAGRNAQSPLVETKLLIF
jgi:hypothetical protein